MKLGTSIILVNNSNRTRWVAILVCRHKKAEVPHVPAVSEEVSSVSLILSVYHKFWVLKCCRTLAFLTIVVNNIAII